jgi:Pyruvate/2-oxoacid:ferredoxin oxidoreductase gamma subunit
MGNHEESIQKFNGKKPQQIILKMPVNKNIINILVAGTGGQGVNTICRILLGLCREKNLYSKSALFKGGAQRHGTVYATIRIFLNDDDNYQWYSSQVPQNGLDILIGLEPWETLRYRRFAGEQTHIWSNTRIVPLFTQRFLKENPGDPLEMIRRMGANVQMKDYTQDALQKYCDGRMSNFLIAADVVASGILPFTGAEFRRQFNELIQPSKQMENQLPEDKL